MLPSQSGYAGPSSLLPSFVGPSGYEPLSVQDQLFLRCEQSATPMHVGALLLLDRGLPGRTAGGDITLLRRHIAARLGDLPRYRKRLAYTPLRKSPVWIDDRGFDVAFHVRHLALPHPRSEATLKDLCGDLLAQPLNPAKPLWEIHVIEGLRGGRTAVVTKAHHCLVDGVRGAHVLQVLLDVFQSAWQEEMAARPVLRSVRWRRGTLPAGGRRPGLDAALLRREIDDLWSSVRGAASSLQTVVRQPRDTVIRAVEAASDLAEIVRVGLESTSASPLNGSNSAARRFEWLTMDLAEIKAIKNRLGGTVNDVVLAILSGALRRFFIERRGIRWPKDLRVLVPVNRRSPEEGLNSGNYIGGVLVRLPVSVTDASWRHQIVCARMQEAKQSRQAAGAELLTQAASALLGAGVELIDRLRPFNLVVSNIPGPQLPLYFAGAPVESMFPAVPLFAGQGASVALFSYAGKLCWGLHGDPAVVPDLPHFASAIRDELAELQSLCGVVTPPRRVPLRHRRPPVAAAMAVPAEALAAAAS